MAIGESDDLSYIRTHARIAIYDDLLSAPRVLDVEPAATLDFIESIASMTYDYSRKLGGNLPYSAIREIAENFIHARFKECTVSILNNGNTIRFSDQGPGIEKKSLVQQPGITSATAEMKRYIRGVGSGFPIVKEYLQHSNGYLSIDDNAIDGTVVTLSVTPETQKAALAPVSSTPDLSITKREEELLLLLLEEGVLGPSDIVVPLNISVSTAFRLLEKLEKLGLVETTANRKRILSNAGLAYTQTL
jgi:hypothetical protein